MLSERKRTEQICFSNPRITVGHIVRHTMGPLANHLEMCVENMSLREKQDGEK